ncbi:hypothetical protein HA402_003124 [Bradysia odoriphaga]|nr:hypothetical protein HA402_003124 [Bradysia odoriphaga]
MLLVTILNLRKISSKILCDRRYLNDEIRIDGKVVIVTGGTGGLGLETSRNLARRGGTIYIASRDEKKGNDSVESIRRSTGNNNVHFIRLDLGSLKSVQHFSETFHEKENRLDVLINNAAIATGTYQMTEDGFETDIGVNHLGHFLLTNLLLELLRISAPSRILVVSSFGHRFGEISRSNLNSEMYYPGFLLAYTNSKLANVLFTRELSRRLENSNITANCLDPGFSMSALAQHLPPAFRIITQFVQRLFGRSPEHASETHVMLAVDPSVNKVSGKYFVDCIEEQPSILATDDADALWLWEASAKLTKLDQYLMEQSTKVNKHVTVDGSKISWSCHQNDRR